MRNVTIDALLSPPMPPTSTRPLFRAPPQLARHETRLGVRRRIIRRRNKPPTRPLSVPRARPPRWPCPRSTAPRRRSTQCEGSGAGDRPPAPVRASMPTFVGRGCLVHGALVRDRPTIVWPALSTLVRVCRLWNATTRPAATAAHTNPTIFSRITAAQPSRGPA